MASDHAPFSFPHPSQNLNHVTKMHLIRLNRQQRWLLVAPASALLTISALFAQQANTSPSTPTVAPAGGGGAEGSNQEVVKMSPFQVQASPNDVGYYAENTLAGTRLNTNIGDLASSITVVTKQQLIDTASVDINDVFMYEANTEGANTYTPVYLNRGVLRDTIGGYSGDTGTPFGSATANRIRGLGSADTSESNYPTIARIPFDTYNTQSVEINRGPNSLLFGTGSPAGIVNQSPTDAVLNKRTSEVQYQVGSFGSYRGIIDHNEPIGDKAAIYVAALYDSKGYERKPSYDLTRRQYVALTLTPFAHTRITASFEHYDNRNNRPNYGDPLDYITPWLQAGRPAYNPVTAMVTILDTGQVMGPYVTSTADPRYMSGGPTSQAELANSSSPFYVPGIGYQGHNNMMIDQGQLVGFWDSSPRNIATDRPATADLTASQWVAYASMLTSSVGALAPIPPASTGATGYGTWYDRGITNQSLYDWTSTNTQSANYGTMSAKTYHIELQQQILPNLNLDVGWFRQELEEWDHYPLGQANQAVRLYVDTNTNNLDGTPNKYFGSPFVYDYAADTFYLPEINNNFRAILAYDLDFTKHAGWTRWLGRHRFLALWTQQKDISNNLRYRLSFDGGDPRILPNTNTSPANNFSWAANASNIQRWYYLGQNSNGIVTHSPGYWGEPGFGGPTASPMSIYNWTTGSFDQAQMQYGANLFYAGGNYGITEKIITAHNFAWQGYLWNNRIIPTLGWRRDDLAIRATDLAGLTTPNEYVAGYGIPGVWNRMTPWSYVAGNTNTKGVVLKPFLNWRTIDDAADNGNVFAKIVRGLSFHYNKSDNFNAPTSVQTDFFGNKLGKPSGTGKDWGFGLNMFNNKLVLNVDWFKSDNLNAPADAAGTAIARIERVDYTSFYDWAEYVVRIRDGQDPTSVDFANNSVTPLTQADQDAISKITGEPQGWPLTNIAGTEEDKAKGIEASLIYNPVRNWTMKLDVGKQTSVYTAVAPEMTAWLNYRMPIWENAAASDMPALVTLANGQELSMQHFWTGYGFSPDARLTNSFGWTSPEGFFNSAVQPAIYNAIVLQNTQVPNERKWTANFVTNYVFLHGFLKGVSVGGGYRWADKAIAGYYGSTAPGDLAHPTPDQSLIVLPDLSRPIYTPSEEHLDLWVAYTTKFPHLLGDNVRVKFQFNVRDLNQSGGLEPILFEPDGTPAQYRILDPRTYYFTTTLDF